MRMLLTLALSAILVIPIFFAGCIDNNQNNSSRRFIIQVHTGDSLSVSREGVKNITEDEIQKVINQYSYKFKNLSDSEYPYYYWFYTIDSTGMDNLSISIKCNNITSLIKTLYSESFPESNLTEKKQWLKERVDEIATICNLTVNWTQVQWTINYAD